jgi:hypothetical protein
VLLSSCIKQQGLLQVPAFLVVHTDQQVRLLVDFNVQVNVKLSAL